MRTGFVFQLNPFKHDLKSLILDIIPNSSIKANTNTLYKIRNILNQIFYQSHIQRLFKNNHFPIGRIISLRINPDFLHIIKRLRYRLLTHVIHMNFASNSRFIILIFYDWWNFTNYRSNATLKKEIKKLKSN